MPTPSPITGRSPKTPPLWSGHRAGQPFDVYVFMGIVCVLGGPIVSVGLAATTVTWLPAAWTGWRETDDGWIALEVETDDSGSVLAANITAAATMPANSWNSGADTFYLPIARLEGRAILPVLSGRPIVLPYTSNIYES